MRQNMEWPEDKEVLFLESAKTESIVNAMEVPGSTSQICMDFQQWLQSERFVT
jgi:hypothetical protein